MIWRCAGDFFMVLLQFEMAAMDEHNFCGRKNSNIEVKNIQISQSHYPPSGHVQVILLKFKMATTSRLFKYL